MSQLTVFGVISGKFNAAQNAGNMGAGSQNPDGSFNVRGTVIAAGQTTHAIYEIAKMGSAVGKWVPGAGGLLSAGAIFDPASALYDNYKNGTPYAYKDIASFVGNVVTVAGAVGVVFFGVSASSPVIVGITLVATGLGMYQLVAQAKGWEVSQSGSVVPVELTPEQRVSIDAYIGQVLPFWNSTSLLSELGLLTNVKLYTAGSVFTQPIKLDSDTSSTTSTPEDAATIATPAPNLNTPARNSSSYVVGHDAHSVKLNSGGTVSDIWLLQKQAGNVFTLEEFGKAVMAANPSITNINQVTAGQVIYIPQKQGDGSITYHYANGASINTHPVTQDYYMVVPNEAGGQTVYSRQVDGNGLGAEARIDRVVQTDATGANIFTSTRTPLNDKVLEEIVEIGRYSFATFDNTGTELSRFIATPNGVGQYSVSTQVKVQSEGQDKVVEVGFSVELLSSGNFRIKGVETVGGQALSAEEVSKTGAALEGVSVQQLVTGDISDYENFVSVVESVLPSEQVIQPTPIPSTPTDPISNDGFTHPDRAAEMPLLGVIGDGRSITLTQASGSNSVRVIVWAADGSVGETLYGHIDPSTGHLMLSVPLPRLEMVSGGQSADGAYMVVGLQGVAVENGI